MESPQRARSAGVRAPSLKGMWVTHVGSLSLSLSLSFGISNVNRMGVDSAIRRKNISIFS